MLYKNKLPFCIQCTVFLLHKSVLVKNFPIDKLHSRLLLKMYGH